MAGMIQDLLLVDIIHGLCDEDSRWRSFAPLFM